MYLKKYGLIDAGRPNTHHRRVANTLFAVFRTSNAIARFLSSFFLLIALIAMVHSTAMAVAPDRPTGLMCDLSNAPLGINGTIPKFGWIVNDTDNDEYQSAYQLIIATTRSNIDDDIGDMWDSTMVISDESSAVPYAGPHLNAGNIYYWKVRTWDREGNAGQYSAPQFFVTALKNEWTAIPIWSTGGNFAYLRKTVVLPPKPIDKAIAFVTARSNFSSKQYAFKFYINGELTGIGPARGYNDNVPYSVFDVTDRLSTGNINALAAACYSYDSAKDFLMQLKVFYGDGTTETLISDGTWKAIDASNIYNMTSNFNSHYTAGPENIDSVKIPHAWNQLEFDDSLWPPATENSSFSELLVAQKARNIEISEQQALVVIDKGGGNYFFDFGKEIIAGLKLTISGQDGAVINVRLGEELSAANTVRYQTRTGVNYDESWTLKSGTQTIENFGYRGFRYGEILNSPDLTIDTSKIKATVIRYPFDDSASSFTSSDPVLNEVWDLCKYSIKATSLDVYQDCPTRERGPYEGDAYINQLSHYSVDREYSLARYSGEFLLYNPTWPSEYRTTSVMQAWADYMATGNKDFLTDYYTVIKGKTFDNYLNENNLVEFFNTVYDLVDWPSVYRDGYQFTSVNTVVNAFNFKATENLAQIASVLDNTTDYDYYISKANGMKNSINTLLLNQNTGLYRDGQFSNHYAAHANFFPLAFGIIPDGYKSTVADHLKSKGMSCGVYGAQYLLDAMYEANEGEHALKLLTSTEKNSWHHMIHSNNATITTEAWDPLDKSNMSFAHSWGTSPANIIPRRLFGITPIEAGYRKIAIKPQTGGLLNAGINLPTIKGTVHVNVLKGKDYNINTITPANTRAKVYVPMLGSTSPSVIVDGNSVAGVEENGYLAFDNVGSGVHSFTRTGSILNVVLNGSGRGSIGSMPTGLTCGIDYCSGGFINGSQVTLLPHSAADSVFTGWSGACSGTAPCTFTINGDKSITATFTAAKQLSLVLAGSGKGSVNVSALENPCTIPGCNILLPAGSSVTLFPFAESYSTFSRWSGDCSGSTECIVTMDSDKSVEATFSLKSYQVTVNINGGSGNTVASSPSGLVCSGTACSGMFPYGTILTVTAVPAEEQALTGWFGACSGNGVCSFTVTGDISSIANFGQGKQLSVTINGNGDVYSDPPGIACPSTECSHNFPENSNVILHATPDSHSTLEDWTAPCSGKGECSVTMDAAKVVNATFRLASNVMIGMSGYNSLNAAYTASANGSTIMALDTELVENLNLNQNKSITLKGGYKADYSGKSGLQTILKGVLTVTNGKINLEDIVISP